MFQQRKKAPIPTPETLQAINTGFAHTTPQEIIRWADATYAGKLCLATMLDAEGCALVAMLAETAATIPIFLLDTGDLAPATYTLRAMLQQRYGVTIRLVYPSFAHASYEMQYGPLTGSDPALCCRLKRWEPARELFTGYTARLAARRQALCQATQDVAVATWEEIFQLVQINPLAHWSDAQLLQFLDEQQIPHHGVDSMHPAKRCCATCPRGWEDIAPDLAQIRIPAPWHIYR